MCVTPEGCTDFKHLMISMSDLLYLSSGDNKRHSHSFVICLSTIASSRVKRCTQQCINCLCLLTKSRVDSMDW